MTVKEQIQKALERVPDDTTVEDALERLYVILRVEEGLRQAERGEVVPDAEVQRLLAKWQE